MPRLTLTAFDFHGSHVRIVLKDGEPWFVASDVAKTLGYSNTRDAVIRHCKGCRETRLPSDGGEQTVNIIREGDVYRLAIKSKLPSAQEFERKVMDEILPSIRKTGAYVSPEVANVPTRTRFEITPGVTVQLSAAQDREWMRIHGVEGTRAIHERVAPHIFKDLPGVQPANHQQVVQPTLGLVEPTPLIFELRAKPLEGVAK